MARLVSVAILCSSCRCVCTSSLSLIVYIPSCSSSLLFGCLISAVACAEEPPASQSLPILRIIQISRTHERPLTPFLFFPAPSPPTRSCPLPQRNVTRPRHQPDSRCLNWSCFDRFLGVFLNVKYCHHHHFRPALLGTLKMATRLCQQRRKRENRFSCGTCSLVCAVVAKLGGWALGCCWCTPLKSPTA